MHAFITGASSGIGAEFARQLARKGFSLTLVARRIQKLESVATELRSQFGAKIKIFPADLSNPTDLLRVEGEILGDPSITLLINNAGFGSANDFTKVSLEKHLAMLRVHVEVPTRLSYAALPAMIKKKSGGIINVASVAAFIPSGGSVNYGSTKSYLVFFSQALNEEIRGTGVHIQALCPGFTITEFHDALDYVTINARERVPKWAWMASEDVVRKSLNDFARRKVLCIPGVHYKIISILLRSPLVSRLILPFARSFKEKKVKKIGS